MARCDYCSVNYTVIGKMETFGSDLGKISALSGAGWDSDLHRHQSRVAKAGEEPHLTTAELTRTYFRQLPRAYRDGLYRLYKTDFEMFGYDFAETMRKVGLAS